VKTLKCLLHFASFFLVLAPLSLAQVPIGPDLVPPTVQIPDPPAGAKAPSAQTTQAAAPIKPSPHKAGEVQVYGAVTDQSNAVLPGATITLTNASGETQTTTSNAQGQFFINAAPGTYSLKIAAKGFKDFTSENLILTANQEIEMDGALEPAAASPEKVEVVSESVGHVETEKAEVNEVITAKQVEETPLNGRNFVSMLTFAPGVSNQSGQDEALVGVKGSVKFSVNGGRVEYNTFSVDGADVLHAGIHGSESTLVVFPSLDAIHGAHQVRHHRLQVGQERRVRPRTSEVLWIEGDRHDRFVPQRRSRADIAVGPRDYRSARERLAAFGADEIYQRHEHPLLLGDITREPLPPLEIGRHRAFVLPRPNSARRGSGQNEYHRRAVERGDRSGETVPRVLADEHRGTAPARVECADLEATVDEPLFIEHSVSWKEELAVDVPDHRLIGISTQSHIERAIIESVVPHLVKPNAHIEWPRCINSSGVLRLKVASERAGCHGDVADAAFDEISG